MKNALILSYNRFPNGDAGSIRQEVLAKLLEGNDFNTTVIGMGSFSGFETNIYNNIPYLSLRSKHNNFLSKINNIVSYKYKIKKYLRNNKNIGLILVVQIPLSALFFVKKYAYKNNIKLLHDSVEWYSPEQFKLKKYSISYFIKDLYNRKLIDKQFKVISISSYLYKHFVSRGVISEIIPVIMDSNTIDYKKRIEVNKINFVYAGSPGKKDYLYEIIKGFTLLDREKLKVIRISIIGLTKCELIKLGISNYMINYLGESLKIIERISRDKVLDNLRASDFSLLLRPNNLRYSNAGFPTKIVESLMTGTPVMCNITSDLGNYIIDRVNGIIIEDCSESCFVAGLEKVLKMTLEERKIMQKNARKTAELYFDYRNHISTLRSLLTEGDLL